MRKYAFYYLSKRRYTVEAESLSEAAEMLWSWAYNKGLDFDLCDLMEVT